MTLARFARDARARLAAGYYAPEGIARLGPPAPAPRGFVRHVASRSAVVAEIKPASPTAGTLRAAPDVPALARAFAGAGAAGLSVLTVPEGFGGSLAALREAAGAVSVPILFKDFVVDERQVRAARASGASAVLLIPDMVDEADALVEAAHDLQLEVLAEAYDEDSFRRAQRTDADLLAVNNRDLRLADLPVDAGRFARVVASVGKDRPTMCLSGLRTRADLRAAFAAGADAVLVGTRLMQADDPAAALKELIG